MKTTIAILGILLGLTVQARTITGEELGVYKSAVLIHINNNISYSCYSIARESVDTIQNSKSLELTDGGQPLLTFSTHEQGKKSYRQVVITTDSSFKKILNFRYLEFQLGQVNDGTLKDPNIQQRFVVTYDNNKDCTEKF